MKYVVRGVRQRYRAGRDEGPRMWPCGLVAMIPALGAGGPGFKSRLGPTFAPRAFPRDSLALILLGSG